MACKDCGDKLSKPSKGFPRAVVEINNPEQLVLFRKVVIPASMGNEEQVPPEIGKYRNVLLQYEQNGHIYIYSSDGIPSAIESNVPQEVLDRIAELEEGKQDKLTAGNNITITDNVISSTVEPYDDTEIRNEIGGLDLRLDTIEGEIPSAASSSNQLADKNFVNSSIATNTANYISNDGEPFTSVEQLEAYSGTVSNNDYAFVTGTDSAGNTYYDRYKATVSGTPATVTWAKEYRLNNSSFTSDQWAAINSGVTSGDMSKLDGMVNIKSIGANLILDQVTGQLSATGAVKTLSAADYNWNSTAVDATTEPFDRVALWLLDNGIYYVSPEMENVVLAAWDYDHGYGVTSGPGLIGVATWYSFESAGVGTVDRRAVLTLVTGEDYFRFVGVTAPYGRYEGRGYPLFNDSIADNLTTSSPSMVLSAKQGKVLKDLIDSLVIAGAGAPTTATVGTVGRLYEDTTNGKLYICTAVSGSTYTWEEVGGSGGTTELTLADRNYPTNNPQYIATWLLPQGIYTVSDPNVRSVIIPDVDGRGFSFDEISAFIVTDVAGAGVKEVSLLDGSPTTYLKGYAVMSSDGSLLESDEALWASQIIDALNSVLTDAPLSANQGRVLNGKIEGRVKTGSGAPTTSTVGTVGLLYEDTTNGKLYQCTAIVPGTDPDPDTYTWEEVGGKTMIELTTADYNWNATTGATGTPDTVAVWKLEPGLYRRADNSVSVSATSTGRNDQSFYVVFNKYTLAQDNTQHVQYLAITYTDKKSVSIYDADINNPPAFSYEPKILLQPADIFNNGDANKPQVGRNAAASGTNSSAYGRGATASGSGSVAVGAYSSATVKGQMDIGTTETGYGYNTSNYRLLTGLYDPQNAHDAATKGYVDTAVAGAGAAAFTTNEWNALWA